MERSSPPQTEGPQPVWLSFVVVLLVLAGIVLTTYFGFRLLTTVPLLHRIRLQPGTTDVELIRNWMTIPYIARAYRVPESTLWEGLGIPSLGNRHKDLRALNHEYGNNQPDAITIKVKILIHLYQTEHPTNPVFPDSRLPTPSQQPP